ncbi:MAG: hypothetical protein ACJ71J_13765 [Nitrososphaeraceae archaeon]
MESKKAKKETCTMHNNNDDNKSNRARRRPQERPLGFRLNATKMRVL